MPTITPQARPVIGGSSEEFRHPRMQIKASTGMSMPEREAPETPAPGQPGIKEETSPAAAVTLSPQLTALARKQQKLQQEIQAQREREETWTKEKSDYVPKSDLQAKAKQNAAEALKEALGMDYNELTQLMLDQQQGADPVKALASEVQALKKSQEENTNKQYEATLKQYKAEAESLVSADLKSFHFISKGKHLDAVVQHIVETWQEDPDKVLTVEQAAKEVEEFLREEAKTQAALLKEIESPQEEPAPQKTLPPPQKAAPRTLTNQVEATPTRTYNQFQHLSMKERIAQAIARTQR